MKVYLSVVLTSLGVAGRSSPKIQLFGADEPVPVNSFNVTLAHVYFAAVSVGTGNGVCNAAVDDCSFTGAGVP